MTPLKKGLILAAVHLAIVGSLGAKLLYDRATRPRVWVETAPYDPDLPIRGRYVSLALVVDAPGLEPPAAGTNTWQSLPVTVAVEGGRLVARPDPRDPDDYAGPRVRFIDRGDARVPILVDRVAFFIPEHVDDPSRRPAGETLWVEVTLPRKGPPRPIRLGVKRGDTLAPLALD